VDWAEVVKESAHFGQGVLTGLDESGYPIGVRCTPTADPSGEHRFLVDVPEGAAVRPGRAGMVFHRHDEQLWNLRSFIARGVLARETDSTYSFTPDRVVGGAGIGGVVELVRFMRRGRRTTKRYLAARSLPRPKIPWDWIKGLWAEVDAGADP